MIWPARMCAIEIAPTEVKAVVGRQRGGSAKVLTLARQPIEQSEDEDPKELAISALERLMEENDLSADIYTGCLPATSAIVRPLQVPFAGRRRVSAALKYEMEPVVPFPIDELIVDYMPIQQHDKKTTDVLAVGMRTETVRFHLEVLEGVGLDPDRLDLDVTGLTNLWRAAMRDGGSGAADMSLMVHVQETNAYFVALGRRAPVLMRVSKGVIMPTFRWLANKLVRKHDVIHLHLPQLDAAGLALRGRIHKKPTVITYHCDLRMPNGILSWAANQSVHLMNHIAGVFTHRIVTYTQDYADHSKFINRFKKKLVVINPPVELPDISEQMSFGFTS